MRVSVAPTQCPHISLGTTYICLLETNPVLFHALELRTRLCARTEPCRSHPHAGTETHTGKVLLQCCKATRQATARCSLGGDGKQIWWTGSSLHPEVHPWFRTAEHKQRLEEREDRTNSKGGVSEALSLLGSKWEPEFFTPFPQVSAFLRMWF